MDKLPLNKLLELMQRPLTRRQSLIKADARRSVWKAKFPDDAGGMDFYDPFWADAKQSILDEEFDLADATRERILANRYRRSLYPRLLAGFSKGWSCMSERMHIGRNPQAFERVTARLCEQDGAFVRIGNILSLQGEGQCRWLVYPYFSKDVGLGARHAKLGLGALLSLWKAADKPLISILDVLRGTAYCSNDFLFDGDECAALSVRYEQCLREWKAQRRLISRE